MSCMTNSAPCVLGEGSPIETLVSDRRQGVLLDENLCDPFGSNLAPSPFSPQHTFALSPSMGVSSRSCKIPSDTWSIEGLLAVSPAQYVNEKGFVVTTGIHLMKLVRNEVFSSDGSEFEVSVKKPRYPFKMSVDESEELVSKIGYLQRAIRSAPPGSSPSTICNDTRASFLADGRVMNGQMSFGQSNPTSCHMPSSNVNPEVLNATGGYSYQFPADCLNLSGLFCISPAQHFKAWNGATVTTGAHLMRLALTTQISADGRYFDICVAKPRFPFKLTVNEMEQLSIKLPCLLQAIRLVNNGPGMSSAGLCNMARNAYNQDTRMANYQAPCSNGSSQIISPIGTSFSQSSSASLSGSSDSGASSSRNSPNPKRLALG